jgi:hypothetical protein
MAAHADVEVRDRAMHAVYGVWRCDARRNLIEFKRCPSHGDTL